MIGLFKATKCARDDDFLDSFLSPEKSTFKFIMMGTREQDYLKVRVLMHSLLGKEPNDQDGYDDNIINDLDIDYSLASSSAFTPWTDLDNLKALQRVTNETQINIINDLRPGKKLIVFDLDYTLFDCKSQVSHIDMLARPGLHEMMSVLYPHYEFVIWYTTNLSRNSPLLLIGHKHHGDGLKLK